MKKCSVKSFISVLFSVTLIMMFAAGCGKTVSSEESEEISTENDAEGSLSENEAGESTVENYYLVTNVYGDGQKPWYLVIEYKTEIESSGISSDDFEIEGYEIEAVYTNSETVLPESSTAGNYVLIEISTDYTTSNYGGSVSGSSGFYDDASDNMGTPGNGGRQSSGSLEDKESETGSPDDSAIGEKGERSDNSSGKTDKSMQGRDSVLSTSSFSNQLTVTFRQTGSILSSSGDSLNAWGESLATDYEDNVNLLVENFSQDTFSLSDGTSMMYSLYLPDDYNEDTEYPLVLFMPDATGEGSDEYLALTESLGGVIWTTEEWQMEHETIVLVPQYEDSNTEDPSYTMELVEEIVSQYSVDTSREYLVGQSSGTIRSIKLLIDYPDEFAGALLVAGQTDSAYTDAISELSTQNIWMICSEGDARAYPGMNEITEAVEAEGVKVTVAQWSAALAGEEQEQLASEQALSGTTINWTIFDADTVMRDDVTSSDATEHMNTWRVAYDLNTVREWLFEQSK